MTIIVLFICTNTVVSFLFCFLLHGNTAQVVKNSSKVGLGDVDLMKCMYGSSVTASLVQVPHEKGSVDFMRGTAFQVSILERLETVSLRYLLDKKSPWDSIHGCAWFVPSSIHAGLLRSATFDFSTDDWHMLSLHGGWANERHINTRRPATECRCKIVWPVWTAFLWYSMILP